MQLILMQGPLGRARSVSLGGMHVVAGVVGFLVLLSVLALASTYLVFKTGARLPVVGAWVGGAVDASVGGSSQQELRAMAVKVGEMKAQLTRLEALNARIAKSAGVPFSDMNFSEVPGMGGALSGPSRDVGQTELQKSIDALSKDIERRGDALSLLDSDMVSLRAAKKTTPSSSPISSSFSASGFGWRTDPFTGRSTMHEGVDFIAPVGTPILAAAAGTVIFAQYHPQFGNLVEIDHGNHTTTRYAHASRVLTKKGDIVRMGQKIAEVGSTGRSTGSHLHFEVRVNDVPQNPQAFLTANGLPRPGPATFSAMEGLFSQH